MSDADLQSYAGTPNWQNDLVAASKLLPRDGKKITADDNGTGKAPVNRLLKQLIDYTIAIHDGIFGTRTGATRRTLKSLEVDGTGGNASALAPGLIKAVAHKAAQYFEVDTGSNVHTVSGSNGVIDVGSGGKLTYDDDGLKFERTASSAANPAKTVALLNDLRPLLFVKAWAIISFNGSGGISTDDGANIGTPSFFGMLIRLPFAQAFDSSAYSIQGTGVIGSTVVLVGTTLGDRHADHVDIAIQGHNPTSEAGTIDVWIVGRMTS